MRSVVPNSNQPLVDSSGRVLPVWQRFFGALLGQPEAIGPVSASGSPISFTAPQRGFLTLYGGTVTDVTLTRGKTDIEIASHPLVPVSNGDVVTISFADNDAPVVNFIPS